MPRRGTRSEERGSAGEPEGVVLVADPGAPIALARHVQDRLQWDVSVVCRRLPADDLDQIRVPDDVSVDEGHVAVLLTDHPRRHGLHPVVAEVETEAATGLVSLPSLGAIRFRERATQAVERVVGELCGEPSGGAVGPFPREDGPPVRFVTGGRHGRLRMVSGMVRANRPWRLLPHLSKAFAAALAVLAYEMLNQTIWQLSGTLGAGRLGLAAVLAIATLVAWLIIDHQMWERPDDQDERDLAVLFNVTTVATLLIGVLFLYVGLLVIGFVVDLVLVDSGLVSSVTREPVTLAHRASLLCLVASIATVGGALGTGFESDEAVRQAAYGFRQRERLERDAPRRSDQEQ